MTHNYTIDSITSQGDQVTVVGSVDGQAVTIQTWNSALRAFPNVVAVRSFLASLMLAAIPQSPASIQNTAVGSFTL